MSKTVEVSLSLNTIRSTAVSAVDDLNARVNNTRKVLTEIQKQGGIRGIIAQAELTKLETADQRLKTLISRYSHLQEELAVISKEDGGFEEKSEEVRRLSEEIDKLSGQIVSLPKIKPDESRSVNTGISDSKQAVSSSLELASNFGRGSFGEVAKIGSDILDVTESFKGLSTSLVNVPGVIGNVASSGAALLAPLGGMAASIGGVLAVAGPVVLVIGAISLGLSKLDSTLKSSKESLSAALQAEENYYKALGTMTSEEVKREITTLERANSALQQQSQELQNAVDSVWKQAVAQFGDAGARALLAAGKLPTGDLQSKLDEVNKQILANNDTLLRYNQGLQINAFSANDAAAAEEKLSQQRSQVAATLTSLETQRSQLLRTASEQQTEIEQQRAIASVREYEDFNRTRQRQEEAQVKAIQQIDSQGQERLAQIHSQGMQRLAQINSQISKLQKNLTDEQADYQKKRSELSRDFTDSQLEATRKEKEAEEKLERDYNKRREQLLSGLQDDLLDAEAANDVNAFIQAQRNGKKRLEELADQHKDELADRQKAFDEQREQAQKEYEKRLADLDEQAQQRQIDIEAQIQEQQALRQAAITAIQEQEAAELARIEASKKASEEAFKERLAQEDEDRKIRLNRQKEDQANEDAKRKAQLDKQLSNIAQQERAALQSVNVIGGAFTSMAAAIGSTAAAEIAKIKASGGGSSSNSGFGATYKGTAFAAGGIVNKPTFALLGESLRQGQSEAVIPFNQSTGIPAGMLSGGGLNLEIKSLVIGNGMTREEVEQGLLEGMRGLLDGLQRSRGFTNV